MPRTAFIDHVGIGVPDLVAAKEYDDGLMHVLGLGEWFETGARGPLNGFKLEAVCHSPEEVSRA